MPTIQERKRAFRSRVFHASRLIVASDVAAARCTYLSGDDRDMVLTAIMRRAAKDSDLRLAICSAFGTDWLDVSWHEIADSNNHLSDRELAQAAAQAAEEAEWYLHHVAIPQMAARLDPECQVYTIIRTEGDWTHVETFEASCLRNVIRAVRLWDRRTIRGVPFLSIFARVEVKDPDGSSFTL
ncbi:hypothetical protein [Paracoccus sp. T5]|uniref:hypothetical protein n=1 Tax=Paracoccus sp. T5 TaxID=3402161 RepID=UPI003AED29C1